jgi:sarcosine oxidase, subunit gamma
MNSRWLRQLPAATRFIFQGDAAARAAAAAIWNVGLSEVACRAMENGTRAALWLGPEEYLLWDSDRLSPDPAASLLELQRQHACSVVDVSHRQVAWEISGALAETILAGACPLDLDAAHFPVGMCTRTLLAKADSIVWRRQTDVFHLEAWRSFAPYVTALLAEIASGYDLP